MAPPLEEPLLRPPPGWHEHGFIADLGCELAAHPIASGSAIALLLLLALGRVVLPLHASARLRTALVLLCVYVGSIAGRAALLSLGHDGAAYEWLALVGLLALAFGVISVSMLILFDLLLSRFGMPRIVRDIVIAGAWGVVVFNLLSRSGVNLVQLVTTSAVVTAIIGLSLQDTLGNIIGGVALQVDSAVSLGDWIRVDDKVTGRVRQVRWRSTVIETKDGDYVLYPNAVLNRAVVTVFQTEGLEHRQWIYFHVHFRYAPNEIIAIVVEALEDTPNVSKHVPHECLLVDFDDQGAKYTVRYRLVDFRDDVRTDSEVRKRIWYALHRHQIELPYPSRNVGLTQLTAEREQKKHEHDIGHRLRALARIVFFAPLSDEERRTLAEGLHFFPFARGETIIRQGMAGDSLFIVRRGRVSIRVGADGADKELAQLGAGDFFGEMSLLTGVARRATVLALEDTECYVVERVRFASILTNNPSLADSIGRLLAERLRTLDVERATHDAEQPAHDEAAILSRIRRFFHLE